MIKAAEDALAIKMQLVELVLGNVYNQHEYIIPLPPSKGDEMREKIQAVFGFISEFEPRNGNSGLRTQDSELLLLSRPAQQKRPKCLVQRFMQVEAFIVDLFFAGFGFQGLEPGLEVL